MSLLSDAAIATAYNDVRNDKTPTDFLVISYKPNTKPDQLSVLATGTGGISELLNHLNDTEPFYVYLRLKISNDELSVRCKFVLMTVIGNEVPVMKKAKVSVHLSQVKEVLKSFAVEIGFGGKAEVNENDIVERVIKAGGANYDAQAQH